MPITTESKNKNIYVFVYIKSPYRRNLFQNRCENLMKITDHDNQYNCTNTTDINHHCVDDVCSRYRGRYHWQVSGSLPSCLQVSNGVNVQPIEGGGNCV